MRGSQFQNVNALEAIIENIHYQKHRQLLDNIMRSDPRISPKTHHLEQDIALRKIESRAREH